MEFWIGVACGIPVGAFALASYLGSMEPPSDEELTAFIRGKRSK